MLLSVCKATCQVAIAASAGAIPATPSGSGDCAVPWRSENDIVAMVEAVP